MAARTSGADRPSRIARGSARFVAEAASLGRRVRDLREARGWTLERADEVTGVDWKHWQKIESGEINVTLATLVRIAVGLDEPVASLFKAPKPQKG